MSMNEVWSIAFAEVEFSALLVLLVLAYAAYPSAYFRVQQPAQRMPHVTALVSSNKT